jgi:hypothetical protein
VTEESQTGAAESQPTGSERPISIDVSVNLPGYTSPVAQSTEAGELSPRARPQCLCACGSQSGHGAGG